MAAASAAAAAPSTLAAAAPVLALYRAVLRAHRRAEGMPPPLRALGDRYAREEFRAHLRGAPSPAQWEQFVAEWRRYAAALRPGGAGALAPGGAAPAALDAAAEAALAPDQRARLGRLRAEAARLGGALLARGE
jgi:hypothetical protein